jgi:hypothetical protein
MDWSAPRRRTCSLFHRIWAEVMSTTRLSRCQSRTICGPSRVPGRHVGRSRAGIPGRHARPTAIAGPGRRRRSARIGRRVRARPGVRQVPGRSSRPRCRRGRHGPWGFARARSSVVRRAASAPTWSGARHRADPRAAQQGCRAGQQCGDGQPRISLGELDVRRSSLPHPRPDHQRDRRDCGDDDGHQEDGEVGQRQSHRGENHGHLSVIKMGSTLVISTAPAARV